MILGTVLAWDVYVLPPDGSCIVFMSHDEPFGVYARTSDVKTDPTTLPGDEIVEKELN